MIVGLVRRSSDFNRMGLLRRRLFVKAINQRAGDSGAALLVADFAPVVIDPQGPVGASG